MLFEMRIENAKFEVTEDWTIDDLEKVLKSLKNNKARDAHGHVYELYKRLKILSSSNVQLNET